MALRWALFPVCLLLAGCGATQSGAPEPRAASAETAPTPVDDRPRIVAFGDSLTAGHGSGAEHTYPQFLQEDFDRRGLRYAVVNAGVGGDTTDTGLTRINDVIAMKPAIVILEFGGNDGLRGLPVGSTRENLDEMIARLRRAGARVVLAGMTLPPNYGPDYIRSFETIYRDLARKHDIPLIPFLLEGVGGNPRFMQSDGIHPNVEGNRRVAQTVFRALQPLLDTPK